MNESVRAQRIKKIREQILSGVTVEISAPAPLPHMLCKNCNDDLGVSRPREKYEHYLVCPNCGFKNYNLFDKALSFGHYAVVNSQTGEEISASTYDGVEEQFIMEWMAEEYIEEHSLSPDMWEIVQK